MKVVDVDTDNYDDVFCVCSSKCKNNPLIQEGVQLKREWFKQTLSEYGSFAKITYYDDEPVAMIMFYPEVAVPYYRYPRPNVIEIFCAYRIREEAKGAGTLLLKTLIDEAKVGINCLDGDPCSFLVASSFNTGEGTSLRKYFMNNGFIETKDELYLELNTEYYPRMRETYEKPEEDSRKAVVFYDMNCEYGWLFAMNIEKILRDIDDSLNVVKINKWAHPLESIKRGNPRVSVNGKVINSYWRSPNFITEIKKALKD